MYDSEGNPILAFSSSELRERFGTLSSNKRKKHHRRYLEKIDRNKLHIAVDTAFLTDSLFHQYIRLVPKEYAYSMRSKIGLDLVKSTLLFMEHPQRQHFSYEGLLKVQILFLRKYIYTKLWGLKNSGYTDEEPIAVKIRDTSIELTARRLSEAILSIADSVYAKFTEATKIDMAQ